MPFPPHIDYYLCFIICFGLVFFFAKPGLLLNTHGQENDYESVILGEKVLVKPVLFKHIYKKKENFKLNGTFEFNMSMVYSTKVIRM